MKQNHLPNHPVLATLAFTFCSLILQGPLKAEINLIGTVITVRSSGAFWPDVQSNPYSNQELVIWVDVADANGWELKGRRIDPVTGNLLGSEFYVFPTPANGGGIIGAITYNSTNHEWFIAYQGNLNTGLEDDVLGQRIDSNGNKIGSYIPLVSKSGFQNSTDVAYNPTNDNYLVVWNEKDNDVLQIFSRLFDTAGSPIAPEFRLSEVNDRSKHNPKAAYNPVNNEFMVVWLDYRNYPGTGQDNGYGDVYGQRVNTVNGTTIGANIPIYSPINTPPYIPDGQDAPGSIACDTVNGNYGIGVQKLGGAVSGYKTVGMVTDSAGAIIGSVFNLSYPNFGAQAHPAFNPTTNTYYMTYEASAGVSGKEISAAGVPISPQETIIPGSTRDNAITVNPNTGQYMQIMVTDGGAVLAQRFTVGPDTTPPNPVTNFTAIGGSASNDLTWTNPLSSDFVGTMIRYRTDGQYPADKTDGQLAVDKINPPGSNDSYTHEDLDHNLTYYYAAFAHDSKPNYAGGVNAQSQPYSLGDFDFDRDVDQEDFGKLQACYSGDGQLYQTGCEAMDLQGDGDVDLEDFNIFQSCMNGANNTPGC
ncbi:MAG: hypothetical protein ACYTF1_26495 [Planctomycetota bacterium]|jgi:hypothetical protein